MNKLQKNYKTLIFDFDGTINDTSQGIYATFTTVLNHFGIDTTNLDLSPHIGPPLKYSYTRLVGEEHCDEAIKLHRKTFVDINAVELSKPYDGIPQLLDKLYNSAKYTLAVASCKYQPHLIQSLKLFGFDKYFTYVYAQTEQRQYKAEVLRSLICENGLDVNTCVMIGDSINDVEGAVANGVDVIGVTYGFGKCEDFNNDGVVALCDSVEQLSKLLA
ncbi:MAG: HAD-IA family hydrolase [Clostridia bacterium]|nr:HAD-IA family hydrolase [Clostridia bacterium]